MNEINGISLSSLPFRLNKHIGILLYQEFPVTTIFSDEDGQPIIKEWVDCDENFDRYFVYKTSRENLFAFIEKKISHYELFFTCLNNLGFIVDEKGGDFVNISVISPNSLPYDYLPSIDSFFVLENGVHTQRIIDELGLSNIKIEPENLDEYLKNIAKERKSEIFNLHIKTGKGVGFGRIDTEILGKALISFDNLYHEVALDFRLGKNRGEIKIKPKAKKESIEHSLTETLFSKAASFSVFIKPKYSGEFNIFTGRPLTESISQNIFSLIESSKENDKFIDVYQNVSDNVIKAYREFLKTITEFDLKIDLGWTTNDNSLLINESFTVLKAYNIITLIDSINTENTEKFKIKGVFRAINCNTGHFTFMSVTDEEYSGYFDKLLLESVPSLTFTDLYEVSMERLILKQAGTSDAKIKDKIIAHYLVEE